MLPIIGETKIDQRFQKRIPDALLGPAPEADIDRIPFAITFVHVTPRTTDPQHMKHTVQKTPVVHGWTRFAATFSGQQRTDYFPLVLRYIATRQDCLPKSSLESLFAPFGNLLCQQGLVRALSLDQNTDRLK